MAFTFSYCDAPIFWTHNSEDKPDPTLFESNTYTFRNIPKCPVSFIDNFTIKVVLPKALKPTILRIQDEDLSVRGQQQTKYYLLNKTAKVLEGGYEYEGILDAWLTFAIPFVKWARESTNANKYPTLVNRFLNNRIYNRYLVNQVFREGDEYFDYQSEELNLIGQNHQYIYNDNSTVVCYANDEKDFFAINTIKSIGGSDPAETLAKFRWNNYDLSGDNGTWNKVLFTNTNVPSLSGANNVVFKLFVYQLDTKISDTAAAGRDAGDYFVLCVPVSKHYVKANVFRANYLVKSFLLDNVSPEGNLNNISELWQSKLKGVYYFPLWKMLQFNQNNKGLYFTKCGDTGTSTKYPLYRMFFTISASGFNYLSTNLLSTDFINKVRFSPTEIFSFNPRRYHSGVTSTEVNTYFKYGVIAPVSDRPNSGTDVLTRVNYATSHRVINDASLGSVRSDVLEQGELGMDPSQRRYSPYFWLTKKISPYPQKHGILNSYALSRAKVLGSYIDPTFKRNIISTGYSLANNYLHTGYCGFMTFNGLNFLVHTYWDNYASNYDGWGSMNCYIDGYSTFINQSRASMNAQLTIAKERSNLATADAVLNGLTSSAKSIAKIALNPANVASVVQNGIGIGASVGSTVTGVMRAQQIYSHAKLQQEAMMVDKRNSARGQQIMSNYADDDYQQKYILINGIGNFNRENSYGYVDLNTISYGPNASSFYDFAPIKAPMSIAGANFYNRLTWNVGMKGEFYLPLHDILKLDYTSEGTRWYGNNLYIQKDRGNYVTVDNPFSYLVLEINELYYRAFVPKAPLDEISAIHSLFSSGVRMWKRVPQYDDRDSFFILDTPIIYGSNDPETGTSLLNLESVDYGEQNNETTTIPE